MWIRNRGRTFSDVLRNSHEASTVIHNVVNEKVLDSYQVHAIIAAHKHRFRFGLYHARFITKSTEPMMNYKKLLPTILLISSGYGFAQDVPESEAAKFSYSAGIYSVRSIKPLIDSAAEFDQEQFMQGVKQALEGGDSALTEEQMREVLMAAEQKRAQKAQEELAKAAEENIAKGDAFREEYAAGEGVQKTDSGLLYKVIEPGEGDSPLKKDTVVVHYAGSLIDGTEFDSSIARGEPATFPLANVIPGWTEIVQLMKPGGKLEVVIPPELAYGERGAGERIKPNSTLVFKIELIEVKEPAAAAE